MTIQETITTEFNRIKEMISPILVDFNKYLEFLASIEDEENTIEYREFNQGGIDYIEITPPSSDEDNEIYTIIAFTNTTLLFYKSSIEESKETVSSLDILGKELTSMQKNYLVVAIAFETTLDYIEEVLTPSEDKDFLETMKELVDGVQLWLIWEFYKGK